MDYLLEQRSDDKTPIKIELHSTEVILGKDYIRALKSYSKVSKSHACLNFLNGSWYIEDLNSKYGVFLDYKKIGRNPIKVQNFSIIGLGGDFINDNVFTCIMCPAKKINLKKGCSDKDLSENVKKKTHSKDKLSSNVNLYSDHPAKNGSNFNLDRKASSQSNEPICTNSNNPSESNWKINLYFRRMQTDETHGNSYLQDESLTKHSHNGGGGDDDVQSTTSSIELMNKIMDPSESIIFQIQKSKNNMQSSSEEKVQQSCSVDKHKSMKNDNLCDTTSSVESLDIIKYPSESILSEIQKSKHSIKRSADSDNEQLHSPAKLVKLSKAVKVKSKNKNKSNCKTHFTSKHDDNIQFSSKKNVQQNCAVDEFTSNEHDKLNLRCYTSKTEKNILHSSPKNVHKNKSLLKHSKAKSISSHNKSEKNFIKEYKIPRLSNKKHTNLTILSKSNAEVNLSILNNSDKYPSSTSTKKPAVKKRFDDYRNLRSSVRSQVPREATTSDIDNCVKQNSLNTQIEFESSISDESPKFAENEKVNVGTKTLPSIEINKPAKNLAPNLSVPYRSRKVCEKVKSNKSNVKIPVVLESEKLKNPSIKDNSHHLLTQSNEYGNTQMDSSSSVSREYTEHLDKYRQKNLDNLVSIPSEPNSTSYSELMSKHSSNTRAPPSLKSSTKCTGSSFAKTVSTGSRNNCYYELVKKIVEMDPKWLHEKEQIKPPPSSITKGVAQLPLSFDSYDTYVNSFLQMILLEVWERVCFMSEPFLKSTHEKKFYFSVISQQYVHGLMKLQCESIVNKDKSFSPYNNSLVILHLKADNNDRTGLATFGVITNINIEPLNIEFMSTCQWKRLPKEWLQNASIWKFDAYVKSRKIAITKRYLMEGNGICNLEDKINLTDALSSLKFSPMLDCILSPDWTTFSVKDMLHSNDYMTIQNDICDAVCSEMKLPVGERKIILLEGPPGSGKTEVIARVCQKLIENAPKTFKILVTAPSHFAVDNIANQMIELNQRSGSEDIKFIRIGDPHFIDPEHLKYSLCEKLGNSWEKIKLKLQKKRIHEKKSSCQEMSSKSRQIYEREIAQLEELEPTELQWDEMNEKCTILDDVNIVLSTFSDCFNLYETKINFSCCIFDETNQATESDTLFPFMFKNNKFFILGDTKQLPPIVKSELAIKYGFQRSILERFQTYFMNKYKKSPAIQLKMQFRMHGDISIFPLRTFYFEDYNPPKYSYSFKKWFLEPYIVLDDMGGNLRVNSSSDKTGCSVITSLCSCIIKHDPVCSTAIIVPSEQQKDVYMSTLPFPNIKVCTIDSIQGQEKSICIFSCYQGSISNETFNKHFSCEKRLNVALTRASHCLIICGPVHLLEGLPYWNALLKDSKARNCYIPFSHGDNIFEIFEEKILK